MCRLTDAYCGIVYKNQGNTQTFIDKYAWHDYNKNTQRKLGKETMMEKEEVLNASRKENGNKDLAEIELLHQAGSHASRVGALVCCLLSLLSSVLARAMIYSPWVIYFSIMGTHWLVRFTKLKRKSDLVVAILFVILSILAFIGFVRRLLEVRV